MNEKKRIHLIAIGGAAMHNLALALHKNGYHVSGSDDEIFEPSKGRLKKAGLLPEQFGWFPKKLTPEIDTVILGMHARKDNPELLKAQQLGLNVVSYPEFLYQETKNKTRVVIAGSHGKTTVTAMVMHVLKQTGIKFDYMVGSQLEGFDNMVSLSSDTDLAVFEGDEYLSSPLDLRSKFMHYKPHVAVINGIAWDHINVFPTFNSYLKTFEDFTKEVQPGGSLFYFQNDEHLQKIIAQNSLTEIKVESFEGHKYESNSDNFVLITDAGEKYSLQVFGKHNMQNIMACKKICNTLNITDDIFYKAISTFKGTGKRLECINKSEKATVYLDFAHSPSKVEATVEAVKENYSDKKVLAIFEMHTFSSLNKDFLSEYQGTMNEADEAIVYFNPQVIAHKQLAHFDVKDVETAFNNKHLQVLTNTELLKSEIQKRNAQIYLFMSSGNFGGIDIRLFSENLV